MWGVSCFTSSSVHPQRQHTSSLKYLWSRAQNQRPPTRMAIAPNQTDSSADKDGDTAKPLLTAEEKASWGSPSGKLFGGFSTSLNMHLHNTSNSTLSICFRDMNRQMRDHERWLIYLLHHSTSDHGSEVKISGHDPSTDRQTHGRHQDTSLTHHKDEP